MPIDKVKVVETAYKPGQSIYLPVNNMRDLDAESQFTYNMNSIRDDRLSSKMKL